MNESIEFKIGAKVRYAKTLAKPALSIEHTLFGTVIDISDDRIMIKVLWEDGVSASYPINRLYLV